MRDPMVSVIMPTYNHASFVAEAIESVLAQEGVDFELIVADDGSTDATRDVVSGFGDPRIRFHPNTVNRGAGVVTNELIGRSRGKYVALINSDDAWVPGKLEKQVQFLEGNDQVAATFGRAQFINRDGVPIDRSTLPFGNVFEQGNRSAGAWLRRFFAEGNCLCHPSMLIRRSVYGELGTYSNRLRQLPDFDMWIRVAKFHEIHVSEDALVRFRILPGENASSGTGANVVRTMNEHLLIAERFFDDVSRERMIDGFGDILVLKDIPSPAHLDIEKALIYFHRNPSLERPYKLVGLLKMRALLESEVHRALLLTDYGIGDGWFHNQMGNTTVLMPPAAIHRVRGKIDALLHRIKMFRRIFPI